MTGYLFPQGYKGKDYQLLINIENGINNKIYCGYYYKDNDEYLARSSEIILNATIANKISEIMESKTDLYELLDQQKLDFIQFVKENEHLFFDLFGEYNIQMIDWIINACEFRQPTDRMKERYIHAICVILTPQIVAEMLKLPRADTRLWKAGGKFKGIKILRGLDPRLKFI